MIFIRKGSTNNVSTTLNELATEIPYDVLFEFTNDTTGVVNKKIFAADDISPATERYNQFNIVENATEDLYNGVVELNPIGYWSYTIYQMPVLSPPSLDPNDAIKILEVGKVLVIENTESPTPDFDDDDEINNYVFDED